MGTTASLLAPGHKEALQGATGAAGGQAEPPCPGGVDAGWVLCSLQGTLIPANATHSIPDPSQQKLAPGTGQKENREHI